MLTLFTPDSRLLAHNESVHEIDKVIFHWINYWPDSWQTFYVFFSNGIKTPAVRLSLVAFVLLMLALGPRPRAAIIQALIAFPFANGMTDVLKDVFKWQRPCVELTDVLMRVMKLTSYGTASAHSANMAAVATVLVLRLGGWGLPWIAIAFFTGISRVYVGVHYPSQVLLGWLCGIVAGLLVVKTWDWIVETRSFVRTRSEQDAASHEPV